MYPQSMFEQKKEEKHHNFSTENYHFYSQEKLQYIIWACFCDVCISLTEISRF